MTDKKSSDSRRKLLKSIAAGSGAVIAGKSLPESWSRPVVDSVMLPAHAQTSPTSWYGMSVHEYDEVAIDTDSHFARAFDGLVNEAHAGNHMMEGLSADSCIRENGDGTVRVDTRLRYDGEFATYSAASVTVAGSAQVMSGTPCRMEYETQTLLDGLGLIPDAQAGDGFPSIITVEIDSVNSRAMGRYYIEDYTLDIDIPSAPCGAPGCPPPAPPPPDVSDIRLKTNIEALSISREGYNLYKFQYIGENNGNTYVGVMAQDVISRNPGAVIQNASGFYMVRYAQLGLKMVTLKQWKSEGPDSVELLH